MTIMPLGNPEFDNELREKREEGYVLLGGAYQDTENEALWERVLFMEDEALAAGLIWEKVSFIVSVREMGLTEKGGRFITKGDYSLGLKPAFLLWEVSGTWFTIKGTLNRREGGVGARDKSKWGGCDAPELRMYAPSYR